MAFSPRGDAAYKLFLWILKGRPRHHNHVSLTFTINLVLFRRNSTSFIWLGFQHLGFLWVDFKGYHPLIVV